MSKVTIQSVAIQNLGPFRERQLIDMTVSATRPVVLIQALNGSGKTTLLTAIQLALYGQAAINASRKSVYEAFIDSLRRNDIVADPVVEVALSIETAGELSSLKVRRQWGKSNSQMVETCSVFRGDALDSELTANWAQFIEDILPAELAQLFLFDGEKIEALANPQRLPDLLRRATEAFLGIGSIDSLINDLRAVERRTMLRSKEGGDVYEQLKSELPVLEEKVQEIQSSLMVLSQESASSRSDLDRTQIELERFTANSKRNGIGAFDVAARLRSSVASATEQKKIATSNLADALSHPLAPIAKIFELLSMSVEGTEEQAQVEAQSRFAKQINSRDRRVLNALERKLSTTALTAVASILEDDRSKFAPAKAVKPVFLYDPSFINIHEQVQSAAQAVNACRVKLQNSMKALELAEKKMAEIPENEQLGGLLMAMKEKAQAVAASEEKLKSIEQLINDRKLNLSSAETRLNSVRARLVTEFKDVGIAGKSLEASTRAKRVFEILKDRMLASKAAWLSRQITTEFKALIRKQGFVGNIDVNPVTYQVTLTDGSGAELALERLSAGERQLLAIAVLSALIKERKGRFPVVVDTPLARLDRPHREALVKHFFSTVSHQVMVLSTDQEVSGTVYEALQPYTNQEFHLHFDEKQRCTSVQPMTKVVSSLEVA